MTEIVIYLIKVILIQGFFFLIYWLCFRNTANHTINRLFLLLAITFSFVIPFIHLPDLSPRVMEAREEISIPLLANPSFKENSVLIPVTNGTSFSIFSLLPWTYGLIVILLLTRSLIYLVALNQLKKNAEPVQLKWYRLFKTSQTHPFSFLKNVFIPSHLFGSDAFDQVLTHECVHVRRFHSVDRLIMDFVVSLFWFNPFIYCYRNALIQIHEYEADEGVLKKHNDPAGYQEVLFSQLQRPQYAGLASHFNFQMIKKRIVMMNKQKKRNGWIYGLIVPVTLAMVFAFSSKEAMQPINDVGDEISSFIGPLNGLKNYSKSLEKEDNKPSILPLKLSDEIRMTSGFGMRRHPVTKEKKMHVGIDFACKVGTEIIATADGSVSKIQNKPGGYGKLIIIDHGNEFKTYYAQLSAFKVKLGDQVKKGQVIALSGNSGMSTGPHLHYEVKKGDQRVDPIDYIKNYELKVSQMKKVSDEKKQLFVKAEQDNSENESNSSTPMIRGEDENKIVEIWIKEDQHDQSELVSTSGDVIILEDGEKRIKITEKEESDRIIRGPFTLKKGSKIIKQGKKQKKLDAKGQLEINSKPEPLYVIDGVQTEYVFDQLNSEDVESISIMSGENAIEVYGEEGKNGVVIITTKGSKKGS